MNYNYKMEDTRFTEYNNINILRKNKGPEPIRTKHHIYELGPIAYKVVNFIVDKFARKMNYDDIREYNEKRNLELREEQLKNFKQFKPYLTERYEK